MGKFKYEWDNKPFKKGDRVKETFIINAPVYIVESVDSQTLTTKCGKKFIKYCLTYAK